MQHKDNKNFPLLEYAHKQSILSEVNWILSDIKDYRFAIAKHLNRLRTLCRLVKIDTKIPLNISDTKRTELALQKAIDEGNPIIDTILMYQEAIVHQDNKIDQQNTEIERLKDELEKAKAKSNL